MNIPELIFCGKMPQMNKMTVKNGIYEKRDMEEMDNETLASVCHLLVDGRQYQNIESDKNLALQEVSRRLND
jgi:hypothetical protein